MPRLIKGIKWLLITVMALILLVVAINIPDQALNFDVNELNQAYRDDVPLRKNGFYLTTGFHVAKNKDPFAVAAKYVKELNQHTLEENHQYSDIAKKHGIRGLPFSGKISNICERDTIRCLANYKKSRHRIKTMLMKNKILMQRYHQLYRYTYFKSTIIPTLQSPIPLLPFSEHRLLLAQQGVFFHEGRTRQAVVNLVKDIKHWRKVMHHTNLLIIKMVAHSFVMKDLQLLSEMMSARSLDTASYRLIESALKPMQESELSVAKVFQYEYAMHVNLTQNLIAFSLRDKNVGLYERLIMPFYKANASSNLVYRDYLAIRKLDKLDARAYLEKVRAYFKNKDKNKSYIHWHIFYNPVGKIVIGIGSSESIRIMNYKDRLFNMEGVLRLVALQVQIHRKGLKSSAIANYVKKAASRYRNPFTGKAMIWDRSKKHLHFYGLQRKRGKKPLSKYMVVRIGH